MDSDLAAIDAFDAAPCTASGAPTAAAAGVPVAIVPLAGDATIVGLQYETAAASISEAVRLRLGPRAHIIVDWKEAVKCDAILFVVEVERDGTACDGSRRWLRQLKREPQSLLGGGLHGMRVGVLALARNTCSFSAASGGAEKFAGATRLQKALLEFGCTLLVPMGCAEVEMEEVDVSVLPWADGVATALRSLSGAKVAAQAQVVPTPTTRAAEKNPREQAAGAAPIERDQRGDEPIPVFAIALALAVAVASGLLVLASRKRSGTR